MILAIASFLFGLLSFRNEFHLDFLNGLSLKLFQILSLLLYTGEAAGIYEGIKCMSSLKACLHRDQELVLEKGF